MRSIWLKRFIFLVATLLIPAAIMRAAGISSRARLSTTATAQPADQAFPGSLAGQLLVASPDIDDPRFFHTVILMVRHNKEGALGIVINRLVEERPIAALMEAIGEKDANVSGTVRIFAGGPVQNEIGFVLHTKEYRTPDTIDIDAHVAMTSSPAILRDIGHNKGPRKSLIAFGYTGWSPGQLENEMDRNDWGTAPDDTKLLFDADRDKVWDLAWARRTINL